MPSGSYKVFKNYYMRDIEKLISNYQEIKGDGRGKRSLDHLMRSGVLLLAAAWESFNEEVIYESAIFLSGNIEPKDMPVEVKKNVSKSIVKDFEKNRIAPFEKLTDDNWIEYYWDLVWNDIQNLNTPKTRQLNGLYKIHLGIEEISSCYSDETLDDFVTLRGQIAHRMRTKEYFKLDKLKELITLINHLVKDTDYYLYAYLKELSGKAPWNNTY
jgi:hypothetical protein